MYARYTEYLKDIMENPLTAQKLQEALSTYPLYQGKKEYDLIPTREELNRKILNHYKYREIGYETVGRFIDELQITMEEIMPKYNELFKTIEIMADLENPFDNVDITETFEQETTGSSTSDGSSNSSQTSNSTASSESTSDNTQSGTSTQNGSTSQTSTSEMSGTSSGSTSGEETDQHTDNTSVEGSGSETSTGSHSNDSKTVKSDTPQSSIGYWGGSMDTLSYASEASSTKDTGSTSGQTETTTGSTTEATGTAQKTTSATSQGSTSSTGETSTQGTSEAQATTETTSSGSTTASSETTSTSTGTDTSTSSTQTQGTVKHTYRKTGQQGVSTFAKDIMEYRQSIVDIEYQIITDDRLEQHFMIVW